MRSVSLFILLLCVSLAGRSSPASARGTFGVRLYPTQPTPQVTQGRRVAILIGVNQPEDVSFPPLRYAEADARALAKVLQDPKGGQFDEVHLFVEPAQQRGDFIKAQIDGIGQTLGHSDTLLVYFAGHGSVVQAPAPPPPAPPLLLPGPDDLPLRPVLATLDTRKNTLGQTGLDLIDLTQQLAVIPARHKMLILDACFNGQGRSMVTPEMVDLLSTQQEWWAAAARAMPESGAVLLATALGHSALESTSLGHGIFTDALLKALGEDLALADVDGDRAVNVYEALDYARAKTLGMTDQQQQPEGLLRQGGLNQLILAGKLDPDAGGGAWLVSDGPTGPTSSRGVKVKVDGVEEGNLPQSIPLSPGIRRVELTDPTGVRMAAGPIRVEPGQVFTLDGMVAALRMDRREFSAALGTVITAAGPSDVFWGGYYPHFGVSSGFRVPRGDLRGLGLVLTGGYGEATEGEWKVEGGPSHRPIFDLGLAVDMERSRGRLHYGGGAHLSGIFAPAVGDGICWEQQEDADALLREELPTLEVEETPTPPGVDPAGCVKVMAPGPTLTLGWSPTPGLTFQLHTRGILYRDNGALEGGTYEGRPHVQVQTQLGARLGF